MSRWIEEEEDRAIVGVGTSVRWHRWDATTPRIPSIPSPTAANVTRDLLPREIHLTIWTKNISLIFGQQSLYRRLLRNPRKTLKCCFKGAAWVGTSDVCQIEHFWF